MASNDFFLQVGERIKQQRILLGYTREELSEKLDITPRFCYDLELGLKKMSLNTLCNLSSVLHLSTDYILFGSSGSSTDLEPFISLLKVCPVNQREHLMQIISSYIQAVSVPSE